MEDVEELLDLHLEEVSGSCKDKEKGSPLPLPGWSPSGGGHLEASTSCGSQEEAISHHPVPERKFEVLMRFREMQLEVEKTKTVHKMKSHRVPPALKWT